MSRLAVAVVYWIALFVLVLLSFVHLVFCLCVCKCSWSPDGHYIVSAHALNNSGPVAKIVERSTWKASMDFVGHRKAVQVTVSWQIALFSLCVLFIQICAQSCWCDIHTPNRHDLCTWLLLSMSRPWCHVSAYQCPFCAVSKNVCHFYVCFLCYHQKSKVTSVDKLFCLA